MPSWEKCGQSVQANGEDLTFFRIVLPHAMRIKFSETFWKKTKSGKLVVTAGRKRTFTRGGATVIFEVRAVLALVVLRAGTVVVGGQVEAVRSVLTRVGRAVIDIQLGQRGIE